MAQMLHSFTRYLLNFLSEEFMNVRVKHFLLTMTLVLLVLLTVLGLTYRSTVLIVDKTVEDSQLQVAAEAARTTEIWLRQQMKILDATAYEVVDAGVGHNDQTYQLLNMAINAGYFSDVYIGLADGTMIDGTHWVPPVGYDPRTRPWYSTALVAEGTAFSKPYIDLTTNSLVIAVVTQLEKEDTFFGVLSADIILDTLVDAMSKVQVGKTGFAFLIDDDGTILVHPNQELVMKSKIQNNDPSLKEVMQVMQLSQQGTAHYQLNGEERILSYQKIDATGWYLCTALPKEEAYAFSRKTTMLFAVETVLKILGFLALMTLLGIGGSALVLYVYNRRFTKMLQQHIDEKSGMSENLQFEISKREDVETRYQTIFNVANDAIMLSKSLLFVECNDKTEEMFGLKKRGIIGNTILDLSPRIQPDGQDSKTKIIGILDKAMQGGQQFFEWNFRRANGTEFPAEISLKTLILNKEQLTLTSIRDISKRADAEEQLRQAQKLAGMGEMLGAIAHQWRQPLNTLSTYIASLQSAFYNHMLSKDFVERLVAGADSQIQFMSKTIDDFRHFFKPSKNKAPFELIEAVESAVKLMEPQLKLCAIQLVNNTRQVTEPCVVFGYQSEFIHVVVNILSNAKDAIEERGKSASNTPWERRVDIDIVMDEHCIGLKIKDSGGGIPEHLITKVFTPYFTTKGTASGTGIGLYMAKMIVEKEMGGSIGVMNTDGGALFTIKLPKSLAAGKKC